MRKVPTIIISVLAVLVLILGGGYFWFSSSVYPALANLSTAIKNKNLDEAKKYVDTEKLGNSLFTAVQAYFPPATENSNSSSIKESIEKSITDGKFVANDSLVGSQTEAYTSNKLVADGSNYKWKVKLMSSESSSDIMDADFFFTKENGGWKVTSMKMDLSKLFGDAVAASNSAGKNENVVKDYKLGDNADTKKFRVKVTNVEFTSLLSVKQDFAPEPVVLKPLSTDNIFAKISYEAINTSAEGTYFGYILGIETADGKTYKPEYREGMYLFEKVSEDKKSLTMSSLLNPDSVGYDVKIIEIPAKDKEKAKVVLEEMDQYPTIINHKWSI